MHANPMTSQGNANLVSMDLTKHIQHTPMTVSLNQSFITVSRQIPQQPLQDLDGQQSQARRDDAVQRGLMHTTWIAGVPGEEGGTERGAQHGQQAWQVLLRMGTQGSQTICHMYQPHFLTRQSERLHRHQAMRLHSSVNDTTELSAFVAAHLDAGLGNRGERHSQGSKLKTERASWSLGSPNRAARPLYVLPCPWPAGEASAAGLPLATTPPLSPAFCEEEKQAATLHKSVREDTNKAGSKSEQVLDETGDLVVLGQERAAVLVQFQGTVAAATPEADGMQDACLSGRGPRGDATCMLLFLLELSGE
ncbi:MAG: hypothetical protein FRX49_08399 [Trebouxia sp. A1-2]|nr:MAG: hypothetical protein FRX49_08399 [Trebouxia sp. A1-2]